MRYISYTKGMLVILMLGVFGAWLITAHPDRWQSLASGIEPPSPRPEQVQGIVNNIYLIQGLPQKNGEQQWDVHAYKISQPGKLAAPMLIEKLTDESPSQVFELFSYTIGDVALALLRDIYCAPDWPSPDGSIQMRKNFGDFRDYVEFIRSKGKRKQIQQSWKIYSQTH